MSKIIFEKELPIGKFIVYNDKPEISKLIHVHQIHSADIEIYKGEDISDIKADGIMASNDYLTQDRFFAIKTADCIPAVFIGKKGIAVIHAGWMGVRDKILIQPELKNIEPYFCFFGPSIHQESFEVQTDFLQHFPQDEFYSERHGKIFYNIQAKATQQIQEYFKDVEVIDSRECTFTNEIYNSYRRDKTPQRNWNIFSI